MKISEAFPSNFLKVDDLKGRRVQLTIQSVEMEEVGEGHKPVVYFGGQSKGLVLNKTNASMIEEIAGSDDTDDWAGVRIVLYPARVDFKGNRVPAIRVDLPVPKGPARESKQPDPVPMAGDEFEDTEVEL